MVVQTVLLLQQNGHGARMSQVELLELLPLDAEGLPALERAAWTNGNKDEQTVLFCFVFLFKLNTVYRACDFTGLLLTFS